LISHDVALGRLWLSASEKGLTALQIETTLNASRFEGVKAAATLPAGQTHIDAARRQIDDWLKGRRQGFDLTLDETGTPFQKAAWAALRAIPFGKTITYSEQAQAMRNPKAVRAVGAANGCNPISIITPCHRVIGASGALTGYEWGVDVKAWLLAFERGEERLV
jgi:methylated-DNA-[protein]-cysteine S-methyltransferase